MKVNFCNETLTALHNHSYNISDIDWIGNFDFFVDVDYFFSAANEFWYDNGYGSEEAPVDVIIVMKDGSYFDRWEYDGSEGWQYHRPLKKPDVKKRIKGFEVLKDYTLPLLERFVS